MADVVRRHFDSPAFNKARYIAAIRHMLTLPAVGFTSVYNKYIVWHATAGFTAVAHRGLTFLAWHRAFLWEFERDLQLADMALGNNGRVGIPWWDWINDTSPDPLDASGHLWRPDFMGSPGDPVTGEVTSGPFIAANWPPSAPIPLVPAFLMRRVGVASSLATADDIRRAVGLSLLDVAPYTRAAPATSFRNILEGGVQRPGSASNLHDSAHQWIGGHMNVVARSPFDPVFWSNHGNVDRIWAAWQMVHPAVATQWPTDVEIDAAYPVPPAPASVLKLSEPMLPWDGSAGTRIWRPMDVLNWQTMGPAGEHKYRYSTDPAGSFAFA